MLVYMTHSGHGYCRMTLSIKANKVSELPALLDYRHKQERKVQHLEALTQISDELGLHESQRSLKRKTGTFVGKERRITRSSPVQPGDLKGQRRNDGDDRKAAPQSSDLTNRQASPSNQAALHEQVFLRAHHACGQGESCGSEDMRPIPLGIWRGSHSPAVSHAHDTEPF